MGIFGAQRNHSRIHNHFMVYLHITTMRDINLIWLNLLNNLTKSVIKLIARNGF